ncbi:MAG: thioredoxin domain-containing protein [Mycetocola sp.]
MKKSTKIQIAIIAAVAGITAIVVFIAVVKPFSPSKEELAAATPTVAENSHLLDVADDEKVTLVEFLDFECEVCGAVYPSIEEIRAEYDGEITYVLRYFPIPSHKNSVNAAIAVEAAAQQGKLEAMYKKMFDTQKEWGEQQESKTGLFRQYAVELGLDMTEFDKAVVDPKTEARVKFDFDAGVALGVEGTPTFFVNDEIVDVRSIDDIRAALDAALDR